MIDQTTIHTILREELRTPGNAIIYFGNAIERILALVSAQQARQSDALKFYADETNYQQRGWQGDPDMPEVESDSGKIAREALEKK